MANTAANVSYGKPKTAGAVYFGGTDATLPTSTDATLTGFTALGYVSDDGLTNNNSPESDNIKAWGGDTVLSLLTSKEDTFSFKLLEAMSADVLKLVYGSANVTGTTATGITVKANTTPPERHSYVFDMVLKDGVLKRIVVPDATITEVGEIVYKDDEAIGYELTITAVPDASGNTHYEYIKK